MLGRLWCAFWAHKWMFLFTNDAHRAVFGCQRCMTVKGDES